MSNQNNYLWFMLQSDLVPSSWVIEKSVNSIFIKQIRKNNFLYIFFSKVNSLWDLIYKMTPKNLTWHENPTGKHSIPHYITAFTFGKLIYNVFVILMGFKLLTKWQYCMFRGLVLEFQHNYYVLKTMFWNSNFEEKLKINFPVQNLI